MSEPKRGDIAICSAGYLGLITSDGQEEVTYPDGSACRAFTGIHLSQPVGRLWSSRSPAVVGHILDLLVDLWTQQAGDPREGCRLPFVDGAFEEATRGGTPWRVGQHTNTEPFVP